MLDINVLIFIESSISKTFLFECSKYWASEGNHVHYISKQAQEELPPFIENERSENQTYAEFMQITFLTAPSTKDFIDYMVNLRKSVHVPKLLVVDDITSYVENSPESEYLLLCSLLKSTAHFCSQILKSTAFLIISSKFNCDKLNTINLILTPTRIWRSYENNENGIIKNYILREISLNPLCQTAKELNFSFMEKQDGKYIRLRSIKHLFEDSCNFNNLVI